MSEPRTETQRIEDRITAACQTIRREWDAMLPSGPGPVRYGVGKAARITAADQSDAEHDVDAITRLVSFRREVVELLNSWARVIVEDRDVRKALPDGRDALGLADFIERHAQWMSGHEAAEDCADELHALAGKVHRTTHPSRKEWISLGECPLEHEFEPERGMETCRGNVRAWPRHEDRDGEVMAKCRRCGTEAVAAWWERKMFSDEELKATLTDAEVVTFVHRVYGKVITQATVRQWVKRQVISPSGTIDGRRVFDRAALVYALDLKERREVVGL